VFEPSGLNDNGESPLSLFVASRVSRGAKLENTTPHRRREVTNRSSDFGSVEGVFSSFKHLPFGPPTPFLVTDGLDRLDDRAVCGNATLGREFIQCVSGMY